MTIPERPPLNPPSPHLVARLREIVGVRNALTDPKDQRAYLHEWRDRYVGRSPLVLRPGSVDEVATILSLANDARVGIVPQSGNTGLVGGQIPFETGTEIVLSLSRLNRIRDVSTGGNHMTVEAGLTLAQVQDAASHADRLFPLAMASQGSCQIGGNLATNAGGLGVLAFGPARNLVLGLEVVLADGRIWNGLRALKKDNTGYDLRDLFIGSEGTLGVITAAVLKLFPKPVQKATAMVALDDVDDICKFFALCSARAISQLTAFEFIPDIALQFVTRHVETARSPFGGPAPWYVLFEISGYSSDDTAQNTLNAIMETALAERIITDGVIASSLKQTDELWELREAISDAQKPEGGSIKHDISVPIESIPKFIRQAATVIEKLCPGARPVPFGHFGDGNIHYNISQPTGMDRDAFLAMWEQVSTAVHDLVATFEGSISAEHGIGRMKRDALRTYKSPIELEVMRSIKSALDPNGILNPGKLL